LYRKDTRNLLFSAELIENGKTLSRNLFFFRPFKDLNIPTPQVKYSILNTDSGFDIELKTDKLAKNVYLQIEDEEGFFSDNYFDMLPGEKLIINLKTDISEEKLNEVLTIRTLDDAF
jgi:beta-mannosidase